jgi:hypothetical protein
VPELHGYELLERQGEAAPVGTEIDLGPHRYVVTKVAASPLPEDRRRCAYLQGIAAPHR